MVAMFIVRFAMLAGWAGAYLAATSLVDANRQLARALEAEAAARLAEVRLLQSQMNPHFLFNALNAVLASKDEPQEVERVTQGLADYLRAALRASRPLEPLGREFDALEGYLTVEEARFGTRLACSIDCDRAARGVLVPPLLVQPLVENAIKYGANPEGGPLRVAVRAAVADGRLTVEVANTGTWQTAPEPTRSHGLGLHGLRRRLELLYGRAASVAIAEADGWVRVRVTVPVDPGAVE
jgi:LytS/YehU family sensor histidine kinase